VVVRWVSEWLKEYLLKLKEKYNIDDNDFNELLKRIDGEIEANRAVVQAHYEDILEDHGIDLEELEDEEEVKMHG